MVAPGSTAMVLVVSPRVKVPDTPTGKSLDDGGGGGTGLDPLDQLVHLVLLAQVELLRFAVEIQVIHAHHRGVDGHRPHLGARPDHAAQVGYRLAGSAGSGGESELQPEAAADGDGTPAEVMAEGDRGAGFQILLQLPSQQLLLLDGAGARAHGDDLQLLRAQRREVQVMVERERELAAGDPRRHQFLRQRPAPLPHGVEHQWLADAARGTQLRQGPGDADRRGADGNGALSGDHLARRRRRRTGDGRRLLRGPARRRQPRPSGRHRVLDAQGDRPGGEQVLHAERGLRRDQRPALLHDRRGRGNVAPGDEHAAGSRGWQQQCHNSLYEARPYGQSAPVGKTCSAIALKQPQRRALRNVSLVRMPPR